MFWAVERLFIRDFYQPVACVLDGYIPFCEYFLLPYLLWFFLLFGMVVYGVFFDVPSFRRFMKFIVLTYTVTLVIYLIFPNCQNLRPTEFSRDNLFTRFMAGFYAYDTNTNVCPSIHVIGAFAVLFGTWHSKHFSGRVWRFLSLILAILISLSTVFLKQHSVLDILAALPLCLIGYLWAFSDVIFVKKKVDEGLCLTI